MDDQGFLLLTGATGLLGRYILHELQLAGHRVAVLVRGSRQRTAQEVAHALHLPGREPLLTPVILAGDLTEPGLGLRAAEHRWLASHCTAVVHAAGQTILEATIDGEPWRTHVEGTQNLLDLCRQLEIGEFHHVSTAFVCGDRREVIREDELELGQAFHNPYEHSKWEAERRVRETPGMRATIYRPSVIVGDSRTGYTRSYQGFYRLLELVDRLAGPGRGQRALPLRLPMTGEEPRNLVPVDWVAQAIVRIVNRPQWHRRTYHLVAWEPVRTAEIMDAAVELLGLDGVRCAGAGALEAPTKLEERYLEHIRQERPYLSGDPVFDNRNTLMALPDLPPPHIDRDLLTRLIRFGSDDRWGRAGDVTQDCGEAVDIAHFLESCLPLQAKNSALPLETMDAIVAVDIRGPRGGQWTCLWRDGELADVSRGLRPDAELLFRLSVNTFTALVRGRLAPSEAFLAGKLEIRGEIEPALKLAILFSHLIKECSYSSPMFPAEIDDSACIA